MTSEIVIAGQVRGTRVLAFCDYLSADSSGGIERVALEVYRRLLLWGADVSVVTALPSSMAAATHVPGLHVHAAPLTDLSKLARVQVGIAPRLFQLARQVASTFQPHVLYANGLHFQGSIVAARLQRSLNLPLVTASHLGDLDHLRWPIRPLARLYEKTLGRHVLQHSTRVIAVSPAAHQHALALGADPNKTDVVPNGVDLDLFRPRGEDTDPDRPAVIMFVGRFVANKGPQFLIEALKQLHKQEIPFRAVFLGTGPLRTPLEQRALALGLPAYFAGNVHDVPVRLRDADILVRPSLSEGMPLGILEAMASRVCVLASDIRGNSDLIRDRQNGRLVTPGRGDELAVALSELIQDSELRSRLASAGYRSVQDYSWDACAAATARVLVDAATAANGA